MKKFLAVMAVAILLFGNIVMAETEVNVDTKTGQQMYDNSSHTLSIQSQGSHIPRSFSSTPGISQYHPDTSHFAQPDKNPFNYQSIQNIVRHKEWWTRAELENGIKNYKFEEERVDNYFNTQINPRQNDMIQIIWQKDLPFNRIIVEIGDIGIKCKINKGHSIAAMKKSALEAMNMGATALICYGQGADKEINGGGYNIGVGGVRSSISDSEQIGSVAVAGIGYGEGWAKYVHSAWGHFYAIRHYAPNEIQTIANSGRKEK